MNVKIIEPSGFCIGVSQAIKISIKAKKDNPFKNVYVLGKLVHNDDALNKLNKEGVITLYKENTKYIDLIDEINDNNALIILTAHGHEKIIEAKLKEKNIQFIDATCPFVTQSFNEILKAIKNNHQVIYIGKRNHPEANAALSIDKNIFLYELHKDFDFNQIEDKSPLVIAQTTFSKYEALNVMELIKQKIPHAKFINGVCHASTLRQDAIMNLENNFDALYIVGGKDSNNTRTLFELAKSQYPNKKIFMIQNKNDINKKDLLGLSSILIASGTSTPSFILEEIKGYLETIE